MVDFVEPTALIGLSTTRGAFDEGIVRKMASLNPRPIVFPLSNPLSKCELTFEDALAWTGGKVIFASGSPFSPEDYAGRKHYAGQGNNMCVSRGSLFSFARKNISLTRPSLWQVRLPRHRPWREPLGRDAHFRPDD